MRKFLIIINSEDQGFIPRKSTQSVQLSYDFKMKIGEKFCADVKNHCMDGQKLDHLMKSPCNVDQILS